MYIIASAIVELSENFCSYVSLLPSFLFFQKVPLHNEDSLKGAKVQEPYPQYKVKKTISGKVLFYLHFSR